MNRLRMIRENLIDPALNASDLPALEKACAVLRSVAEVNKIEADISSSIRSARSEGLRFWIPIFAPIITALALIGALVFQIQQFKDNSKLQRQANEDTQWRDALTHAKSNEGKESALALTLIRSFFDSDRYQKEAREVLVVALPDASDPVLFDRNLNELMQRTNWDNFQDIVTINRTLYEFYQKMEERVKMPGGGNLQNNSKYLRDAAERNFMATSKALVQFLRDPVHQPRPSNMRFDFTHSPLWNLDLSNIDFRGALFSTSISRCNLNNADLSGAILGGEVIEYSSVNGANFSGVRVDGTLGKADWSGTAWWRAKKMSPDLLKYLKENFEFSKGKKYVQDNTEDYSEYENEVDRLSKNP